MYERDPREEVAHGLRSAILKRKVDMVVRWAPRFKARQAGHHSVDSNFLMPTYRRSGISIPAVMLSCVVVACHLAPSGTRSSQAPCN
jgi:hypothetical protein